MQAGPHQSPLGRRAALPGAPRGRGQDARMGKGLHSEVRLAALYLSCPPWTVAMPGFLPERCPDLSPRSTWEA